MTDMLIDAAVGAALITGAWVGAKLLMDPIVRPVRVDTDDAVWRVPMEMERRMRRPRAPLPKKRGGAHRVKTKALHRKRKHKKQGAA